MASPSLTAIFVLFLLSATLVLPSHALVPILPDLLNVNSLKVNGRLYCSADGNYCPTCSGLGGVNVTIICNNGTISLGSLITDTDGVIDGVVDLVSGLPYTSLFCCYAKVQLPVANCPLLPTTGILKAPLLLVGFILGLLGKLLAKVILGVCIVVNVML